ncbi:MAG: FtsX-like permease family protein [bacterium]|nr:FtsX-like permease family protein [bacterium]
MIVNALFVRPVLRRPWRFLMTLVGVAVGVASVVATVLASQAAVRSMSEDIERLAGRARLEIVRTGDLDETLLGELRPFARDAVLVPVLEERALAPDLNDALRVFGVDFFVDRDVRELEWKGDFTGDESALTGLIRGEGVLAPASLLQGLGVKPGGSIRLSIRGRVVDLPVLASFQPEEYADSWDRVLLLDIAYAQELFGRVGRVDRIEAVPRPGVNADELRQRLRAALPGEYRVESPAQRGEESDRMVRALRFNLTALSGISLLVGAVLVGVTLYTSVVQRRYLVALLRSMGASRAQIAGAVLIEAAAIGLLGGVLGAALGYAGALASLKSIRASTAVVLHDAPASSIEFRWSVAAAGVLLGCLASLLASVGPLMEALRTPPLQGLRREKPGWMTRSAVIRSLAAMLIFAILAAALAAAPPIADLPYAALGAGLAILAAMIAAASPFLDGLTRLAHLLRFGPHVRFAHLAMAGLAAGRGRAAWAAGAIGVSSALAIAMAVMVTSFRQTVVDWTNQGLRSDVWIRPASGKTGIPTGRLDPQLVSIAQRLFGEDCVDPFHSDDAYYQGEKVTLSAGEFRIVQTRGTAPFRDGRPSAEVFAEALRTHGAVVNEPFAQRFHVERGDTITLQTRAGEVTRKICGVFYDYSNQQGTVIIDRNDFLTMYPNDGPQGIALFLPPGASPAAARERLRAELDERWAVDILLNRELREEILRVFDRTFAITAAMQAVASAVAALTVAMTLYTLVSERRRDLAILRALGASRGQIARTILWKAGLLGALGAGLGLIAGALLGVILVKIVNLQAFHWSLRLIWPLSDFVRLTAFVLAACLIAGAAPAWSVIQSNQAMMLRDDE